MSDPFKDAFNEHGLAGNSGFVNGLGHVNAPYGAESGFVFIDASEDDDDYPHWERIAESLVTDPRKIIKCSYCAKPAVRVDHSWLMLIGATSCADHKDRYDADG